MNEQHLSEKPPYSAARSALKAMIQWEPQRHPLIFGFVAAIGTPFDPIFGSFTESLRRYDYSAEQIHLSRLLDRIKCNPWSDLPDRSESDYYQRRMDAGDNLRAEADSGSAMAAMGIVDISDHRSNSRKSSTCAYFLRSLKHPEEVRLLRHIYGDSFFLVAIASSYEERLNTLSDSLSHFGEPRAEAERLIDRDQNDDNDKVFGQNVRDTYAMADIFIPTIRGDNDSTYIDRFVDSIFGAPFLTPFPNEEAMRFAYDASLRSAAAGRQVGAALIPKVGAPIVAGTNEVPKAGGGQYWEGDSQDHRDFKIGEDPNPNYIKRVMQEFIDLLNSNGWLHDEYREVNANELVERLYEKDDSGISMLSGTRISELIEFTRCLHAEQATIINAARAGVSTQGAQLFSTTFPCHECAKMIIGSGIAEVFYIEPYPKSLVNRLFRDIIDTSPPIGEGNSYLGSKVPFRQFIDIAPRRYSQAFEAGERKVGSELIDPDPRKAFPQTSGWNETGVEVRESSAIGAITRVVERLELEYEQELETLDDSDVESSNEDSLAIVLHDADDIMDRAEGAS